MPVADRVSDVVIVHGWSFLARKDSENHSMFYNINEKKNLNAPFNFVRVVVAVTLVDFFLGNDSSEKRFFEESEI